ncbi:MAG TPA: hypothetical protein VGX78_12600 [Pirellulales bacterium]|nr:hypothetical protein [Pirellulales bacterium]
MRPDDSIRAREPAFLGLPVGLGLRLHFSAEAARCATGADPLSAAHSTGGGRRVEPAARATSDRRVVAARGPAHAGTRVAGGRREYRG